MHKNCRVGNERKLMSVFSDLNQLENFSSIPYQGLEKCVSVFRLDSCSAY